MSHQAVTIRTALGDEKTLYLHHELPAEISINVSTHKHNLPLFEDVYTHNHKFSGKTFARVGETMVYEEIV